MDEKPRPTWTAIDFAERDLTRISDFRKEIQALSPDTYRRCIEPSYFEWKLLRNPYLRGDLCFVEDGGKIISQLSITPKPMKIFQERSVGAELGDAITSARYRRRGLFGFLLKATLERALNKNVSLIYGQSNERTLPGERKAGYDTVPHIALENTLRILDFPATIRLKIGNRRMAKALGGVPNLLFRGLFRISKTRGGAASRRFEKIDRFDARFNALFEIVSRTYDVMLVRDAEYLNWRFIDNPDDYDVLALVEGEEIAGYIVTKTGRHHDLTVGYIADYLARDPATFGVLLNEALRGFREKTVDIVSCWALRGSLFAKTLRKKGFVFKIKIPFIVYQNELGRRLSKKPARWYFTMADSDNI